MHTPLFSQGYEQQGLWPPETYIYTELCVENSFSYFSQFDLVCTADKYIFIKFLHKRQEIDTIKLVVKEVLFQHSI